jgi:hypothetical protein
MLNNLETMYKILENSKKFEVWVKPKKLRSSIMDDTV